MKKFIFVGILLCSTVFFSGCVEELVGTARNIEQVSRDAGPILVAVQEQGLKETEGGFVSTLRLVSAGVRASAPWNPYATVLSAGLGLLSLVLGVKGQKTKTALTDVVIGNNAMKDTLMPESLIKFKQAQTAAQSTQTHQLIAGIRKSLAVR